MNLSLINHRILLRNRELSFYLEPLTEKNTIHVYLVGCFFYLYNTATLKPLKLAYFKIVTGLSSLGT